LSFDIVKAQGYPFSYTVKAVKEGRRSAMAENESLDLMNRNSRRWFHLCERIVAGASDEEITEKIVRNAYKTMQNVQKQLPLAALLNAAVDCQDIAPLVRDCDGHDYARLIELEQRPFDNRDALMERVVDGMADRFFHQMGMKAVGCEAVPNIQTWGQRVAAWKSAVKDGFRALAAKLASNPVSTVRTPARNAMQLAVAQRGLSGMSLLGRRMSP